MKLPNTLKQRVSTLNSHTLQTGPVVYWMIRDQRAHHNWALLYAQHLALKSNQPLVVVLAVRDDLRMHSGTARMLDFMLQGLQEVEQDLASKNIPVIFLVGDPVQKITEILSRINAGVVVTDLFCLNIYRHWQKKVAQNISVPLYRVDAHRVVPINVASPKQEYAARTLRPKIHRQLTDFLTDIPALSKHPVDASKLLNQLDLEHRTTKGIAWAKIRQAIKVDESVQLPSWIKPGFKAGMGMLGSFIANRLDNYHQARNDPNAQALSNLSPYLHFGQISVQTVARAIKDSSANQSSKDAFLEELIVRRHLAANFCFYNQEYATVKAFPTWAQQTLAEHATDPREHLYTQTQLETAQTADLLWNAAQLQMVTEGKMHGYLRMYWAKKLLEWTPNVETALNVGIYLNDKYQLDGRDPNGYVGLLWSLGGVHDRPWFERPIFGKIRYMNYNGASKKFDVTAFEKRYKT